MADIVYRYMKLQNRPFTINDVVLNLHNEYGKTAVQKAMDKLVIEGKIFEKVSKKQKVYCPVQDSTLDVDELMRIDRELQVHADEHESKYEELRKEIKVLEALLKSSVSEEDARKEKAVLQESIDALTKKLDALMETSGTEDLTETKYRVENALKEYSREYMKRKRLCTEISECILENYPSSKSELFEEAGVVPKVVQ